MGQIIISQLYRWKCNNISRRWNLWIVTKGSVITDLLKLKSLIIIYSLPIAIAIIVTQATAIIIWCRYRHKRLYVIIAVMKTVISCFMSTRPHGSIFQSFMHNTNDCVLTFYCAMHYSAKRGLAIVWRPIDRLSVCLSVRNVGGSGPHWLEILETNYTDT